MSTLYRFCNIIGEHPAAMQRGCANTRPLNLSTLFYLIALSMVLQHVNNITHGYSAILHWLLSPNPSSKMKSISSDCVNINHQPMERYGKKIFDTINRPCKTLCVR